MWRLRSMQPRRLSSICSQLGLAILSVSRNEIKDSLAVQRTDMFAGLDFSPRTSSARRESLNSMSKQASEHHNLAAEHHEHAARHHRDAAKHHEAGDHEKAAHHAHVAHGHHLHATHHATEAAKHHVEAHGEK